MEGIISREKDNGSKIEVVIYNNCKLKKLVQEIRKIIEDWQGGGTILMIGDFNTRIEKGEIGREGEANERRNSEDKKLNSEEMKLLSF